MKKKIEELLSHCSLGFLCFLCDLLAFTAKTIVVIAAIAILYLLAYKRFPSTSGQCEIHNIVKIQNQEVGSLVLFVAEGKTIKEVKLTAPGNNKYVLDAKGYGWAEIKGSDHIDPDANYVDSIIFHIKSINDLP